MFAAGRQSTLNFLYFVSHSVKNQTKHISFNIFTLVKRRLGISLRQIFVRGSGKIY